MVSKKYFEEGLTTVYLYFSSLSFRLLSLQSVTINVLENNCSVEVAMSIFERDGRSDDVF